VAVLLIKRDEVMMIPGPKTAPAFTVVHGEEESKDEKSGNHTCGIILECGRIN
jgi:hypothetical protein